MPFEVAGKVIHILLLQEPQKYSLFDLVTMQNAAVDELIKAYKEKKPKDQIREIQKKLENIQNLLALYIENAS